MKVLSIPEVTMVAGGIQTDLKEALVDALTVGAATGAGVFLLACMNPQAGQKLHENIHNVTGSTTLFVLTRMMGGQSNNKSTSYNFIQDALS